MQCIAILSYSIRKNKNLYIQYPFHSREVQPYDIALLQLENPIKFNDKVAPIKLPEAGAEPVGHATMSGWGSMSTTNAPNYPEILQRVTMPIIDRKTCNDSIIALVEGGPSPLHVTNMCTGPLSGGHGACSVSDGLSISTPL